MPVEREFSVVFQQEDDGWYSASVPALPGCGSQGRTKREALRNIQDAIEVHMWGLEKDGLPMPSGDREVAVERVRVRQREQAYAHDDGELVGIGCTELL